MMGWTEVFNEWAAVVARRVTESQDRGRAVVNDRDALQAAADVWERVHPFNSSVGRTRTTRDSYLPSRDDAAETCAGRLADFRRLGKSRLRGMCRQDGA